MLLAACGGGEKPRMAATPAPTWSQLSRQALADRFQREALQPGAFVWDEAAAARAGPTDVIVNLGSQTAYVYRAGQMVGAASVSSGKRGHETPTGRFPILEKKRHHRSNRYENAPMPYMMRLNWWGVALHGGANPGEPASHGCVRLPMAFAAKLFAIAEVGSAVYIEA